MSAVIRLAAVTLCALAAASAAQAQKVHSVPNVAVPSSAARTAQVAPNPTGLRPMFPAGLSEGSGAAVSTNPAATSTSTIPVGGSSIATTTLVPSEIPANETTGSATTTTNVGAVTTGGFINNAAAVTTVMGAGATVRGPGQTPGGAGGISAVDAARAFFFADANHDSELTRAEFARLPFHTESFEEMDRNFDGVISRFEWEDSLR
jgi:hypothetical protein